MAVNPTGSEFQVNTYTPGNQSTFPESPQSIAMDTDGDFVVTWSSYGQNGSDYGIYGRRYNADGSAAGGEFQVNTTTLNNQLYSTVAMDNDGDFVVTWSSNGQDGDGYGIYGQRYNANGSTDGGEFRVNTTTNNNQFASSVAMDAIGDFAVAWRSPDGNGYGVYGQSFETPRSISINDIEFGEGNSGTKDVEFTVTLSEASNETITVDYSTTDGTATAESDYNSASGIVTFDPGETTKNISIKIQGDFADEPDETFKVELSNASSNATITKEGTATILDDDDAAPTVSISPPTISKDESNSGLTAYTYTVTLANASNQPVSVNYSTNNGTATVADGDYINNDGTLIFAPGKTEQQITVNVNGDTKAENNETFNVKLDSATNATIDPTADQSTGTISNDDAQPTISISDALPVTEGNSGTSDATFIITLSEASGQTVSVTYDTEDGTATTLDDDYSATGDTVTFDPGETSKTITVAVNGDTVDEANENFFVNLSNPTKATITDGQGQATIIDDDETPPPTLALSDATVIEGGTGTTNATFTVTRTGNTTGETTVNYATSDGSATAQSDYTAETGTLTFGVGETTKMFTVVVKGDNITEGNEAFVVNLSNPDNATITDGEGTGTITDDDTTNNQTGTDANETFTATRDTDNINAAGGNDKVIANVSQLQQLDTIDGGAAKDTFILSAGSPSDTLTINATNTNDQLQGIVGFTLQNFESFDFTDFVGSSNFTGSSLGDSFKGGAGNDTITDNDGNDNLDGGGGDDTITGGAGNDILTGGAGIDSLIGGAGNDTYFVDNINDKVSEAPNSGLDTVRTSASFTLSDNVENLTLLGNSAINGTGNAINNTLFGNGANNILTGGAGADNLLGNAGNDQLNGGAGADILTTGRGSDKFLYNTNQAFATADVGVDTLTDFVRGSDKIVLDKTTFTALDNGFSFARVTSDAAADNSSADVVYSSANGSTSGKLFYNTNGTADGFGSGAQFAVLTNLASPLSVSDFLVVV